MTKLNFKQLDKYFRENNFPIIENDTRGIRFLKLRSMSRKNTMEEFASLHNIDLTNTKPKDYFSFLFELEYISDEDINNIKYNSRDH